MGLLKSRKDAGKEFEKYVDAVEHPPELDDYVESEELTDQDTILPGGVAANINEVQAQLAAHSAKRQPGDEPAATDANEPINISTAPLHRKRLGEVLVERNILSEADLGAALEGQAESGKRLGEYLVDTGILDERDLASALADQFNLEVVDLRREVPQEEAVAALPEQCRARLAFDSVAQDRLRVRRRRGGSGGAGPRRQAARGAPPAGQALRRRALRCSSRH